jgi:putative nucleotidyltransferase with HDIG domain
MTKLSQNQDVTQRLRNLDLPTFPAVAIRALQLVGKSDTRLAELHELICNDPVFAGEILKLANSPLYGIRAEITSTLQATMLLGFGRVRALALTLGIRSYLSGSIHKPALRACWRHSLACALIAEQFAGASAMDGDAAYTGALLHDLGRMSLGIIQPDVYGSLLQCKFQNAESILERERELYGIDHCQAGSVLLTAWHLPNELIEIASQHQASPARQFDLPGIVGLSCRAADLMGFEVVPYEKTADYQLLLSELPDTVRAQLPAEAQELVDLVVRKIACIESIDGPTSLSPELHTFHGKLVSLGLRVSEPIETR